MDNGDFPARKGIRTVATHSQLFSVVVSVRGRAISRWLYTVSMAIWIGFELGATAGCESSTNTRDASGIDSGLPIGGNNADGSLSAAASTGGVVSTGGNGGSDTSAIDGGSDTRTSVAGSGGQNNNGASGSGGLLGTGGIDAGYDGGGHSTGGTGTGGVESSGGTGGVGATGGAEATGGVEGCGVPTSFQWTSSAPLITPPSGALSIKDPTVVFDGQMWQIYATTYTDGYSMVHLQFTDWAMADSATKTPVASNPNLTGYKCAPQLFYFRPQNLWYLVYQTQPPAYATTTTPGDVSSWSRSQTFMPMPSIITNSDTGGIDYWVICTDATCYMFFSADNGVLYRAKTAKASFPNGFEHTTEIVMEDSRFALFEACNVYKMAGTDKYLLIVEAIGNGRYFRSWTADDLEGTWTPLADTQSNPFASMSNVTGADWSNDGISHGEMLRENPDETMTIDTCNMRYLFQGRTVAGSSYNLNQYSLGLLTDAR